MKKKRLKEKIKLEVYDIREWEKMGTGSMSKQEILQDVTYFKIDATNFNLKISNVPYEGPPHCKISWKNKKSKITGDLNEAINIISQERLDLYKMEIYSWHDGGRTSGDKENYIRKISNNLYEAICIISQLGSQKYRIIYQKKKVLKLNQ